MKISAWPAAERPREKLLCQGAASLSDAELLAIFLRVGIPGRSALDIARELLQSFAGVRGVLEASRTDLCRMPGVGVSKFVLLQAATELVQRQMLQTLQRVDSLTSSTLTRQYVRQRMRAYTREIFLCLFLDNQHRVIASEELFQGTLDGSMVHPREVLKRALYHNAAALIFAHNHPSGVAEPSQADIHITQRLKSALDLLDIRTLDHLIVGDAEVTSFAERGLI